jgi:hypothetical protein
MRDLTKHTDTQQFYLKIESRYNHILENLLEEDSKRVEYFRGKLAAYSEILQEYSIWKPKASEISYFK